MSDKSRRRKARESGDSEKLSEDSYEDNEIIKGSEEEGELNASTEGTRESEYETVEDDSETEDSTAVDEEEDDDDSVIVEYEREEGDGQESIPPKEKKLDDDEDRRNPQYIPKRGTFYEHDDRTATEDVSGGETNDKEAADRASKEGQGGGDSKAKKVWREHENRWSHDRYNEDEQAPKSREELIAVYGYDIRNEEGPPRARRRRRYGRGPNKYTRNWEDEDAYSKPQVSATSARGGRRGGRRGGNNQNRQLDSDQQEEFPPLISNKQENNDNSNNSVGQNPPIHGSTYSNRTMGSRKNNKEDRNSNRKPQQEAFPPLEPETHHNQNSEASHRTQISTNISNANNREESANPTGRRVHRDTRDGPFTDAAPRGGRGRGRSKGRGGGGGVDNVHGNPVRGRGGSARSSSETRLQPDSVQHHHDSGNESAPPPAQQQQQHLHHQQHTGPPPSSFQMSNRPQEDSPREYHRRSNKNTNIHPQHHHQQQQQQTPQAQQGAQGSERRQQMVVPPRMQHQQQQQQQQQDNSSSNRPKRYSSLRQRPLPESGTTYAQPPPSTAYYQPAGYVTQQPVYGDTPQNPQSAGTPPLQLLPPHPHPATPAYAAPFPSPTTTFVAPPPPRILPPGAGAPPPYIPAPTPGTPIINYVAPPPTYTAFQGYTAVPTAGPPTELYQAQSGITYYNTEEQNIVPRPITQKRQRSAIPIVPPPERVPRGRGRTNREEITSPGEVGGAGEDSSVPPPAAPSPPPPPPASNFEDAAPPPSSTTPTATKVA
ncbi:protein CASC3-like isoform X2 [Periplaneta americana]|uniref:protein CASC3-like isoform X2 n=1 Tax=Periplaneta americana TaxID=6978 RepID=UPI0037E8BF88